MSVLDDFTTAYETASPKWNAYWSEAEKDLEFKLGKQWSNIDKAKLKAQDRDILTFNRCRRVVHALSGYQRKNRLAMRIEATNGSDQTAALLSGCVQWQMNYESAYPLISKAFENGPLTTGLNFIELYMDYQDDPLNGDIKFARIPYNQMLLDAAFSDPGLTDCRFALRRRWVTKLQAKSILPGKSKSIDKLIPRGPDNKFPKSPPPKDVGGKNMLRLDQFFRQDSKKIKQLLNMLTGQLTPWEGTTADLDERLNETSPYGVPWGQLMHSFTQHKTVVKVAYLLDDKEMYDGDEPMGLEDYPFVPFLGYWEPEYDKLEWKLQGVVRAIRDPQTESNRRRAKLFDLLDTQLLGMAVEMDALVDPASAMVRGQGMTYFMKPNRLEAIKPLLGPSIPPGTFESAQMMDKDMDDMLGVSAELTGLPEPGGAAESFILAKLREGASLTIFQPLFDPLNDSIKQLGQKTTRLVQMHYGPQKVQRITKKQPTPEFKDKSFGKYDCTPCEGALTDSQKKMRYGEALALKKAGLPIPASLILEYSGMELEPELIQQVKQQEQMQQQITMQRVQSEMAREKMAALLDQMKAQEMDARTKLTSAKAMQVMEEIGNMNDEQLLKHMELIMKVEKEGGLGFDPVIPQPEQQNNVIPMRRREEPMITTR